jgi:hypothetical protein
MPERILHIANHPQTLELIAQAEIPGDGLAWQDPLYEGPILAEPLEVLSSRRAQYFTDTNWGNVHSIRARFRKRDEILRNCQRYDTICLWFDHDMQDQLQLLQLLNWFAQQTPGMVKLQMVYTGHVRGVHQFSGLEHLFPYQVERLYRDRMEVSDNQMELAGRLWTAVTSDTPHKLLQIRSDKMPVLPFMKDAVLRLLEEYPDKNTGLSRSERQIVQVVYSGVSLPNAIYELVQRKENIPFMGRQAFRRHLHRMTVAQHPLIALKRNAPVPKVRSQDFLKQHFYITNTGFRVLAESADAIFLNGLDRWVGGVHLSDANIWRRNSTKNELKRTYA